MPSSRSAFLDTAAVIILFQSIICAQNSIISKFFSPVSLLCQETLQYYIFLSVQWSPPRYAHVLQVRVKLCPAFYSISFTTLNASAYNTPASVPLITACAFNASKLLGNGSCPSSESYMPAASTFLS